MALTRPSFVSILRNWIVFDFVGLSWSILLTCLMNSMDYIDGFLAKHHELEFSRFCGLNFVNFVAKIMDFELCRFFKISMIEMPNLCKKCRTYKVWSFKRSLILLSKKLGIEWQLEFGTPYPLFIRYFDVDLEV